MMYLDKDRKARVEELIDNLDISTEELLEFISLFSCLTLEEQQALVEAFPFPGGQKELLATRLEET